MDISVSMGMGASADNSIWSLCSRLRAEKLLIDCEVSSIHNLHEELREKLIRLGVAAWLNHQHQVVLRGLISSDPQITPDSAAGIAAALNAAQPIEAYRRLGYHHSFVARLLTLLILNPSTIAELINSINDCQDFTIDQFTNAIFSLVFSSGIFPCDEKILLETVFESMRQQLAAHPNPRLVLRKGTSGASRLYKYYSENLYSAKIFLTSALHDSVMLVLCQDEIFLDIDPQKSALRFPPAERVRRFGQDPTSSSYHKRMAVHRKLIVEKLVLVAHSFIKGILDALPSFPPGLIWLVKQLYSTLVHTKGMTDSEAQLICTDLIVTSLLCPAVTNPENVGVVSDTPISHIARFNLMQIGQIIQTLALSRHETPPPHFQIFTAQFKDSPICSLVQSLLDRPLPTQLEQLFPTLLSEPFASAQSSTNKDLLRRTYFIGSTAQVNTIISVLKCTTVMEKIVSQREVKAEMEKIAAKLPQGGFHVDGASAAGTASAEKIQQEEPRRNRLKNFADKVQTSLSNSSSKPSSGGNAEQGLESLTTTKPSLPLSPDFFDLLIFTRDENELLTGLKTEDDYMAAVEATKSSRKRENGEKRARFVEDGSIVGSAVSEHTGDNASDLEEEVGSISSSCEAPHEDRMLELLDDGASTLPDNVSDASLSGRTTPLSQKDNDQNDQAEDAVELAAASTRAGAAVDVSQRNLPRVPVAVRKQNAEGLEEKFGKFTVPTTADGSSSYKDDQRSLMSDCWSTNVVASDDEGPAPPGGGPLPPPVANQLPLPNEQDPQRLRPNNRSGSIGGPANEDRSDTWSLDAIASDSEADGGRERERQVREIQEDVQRQEELEAAEQLAERLEQLSPGVGVGGDVGDPPLIQLSPSVNNEQRRRRRSSGSSLYSRSEADSDVRFPSDDVPLVSLPSPQPSSSSASAAAATIAAVPPPLPSRPPVTTSHSLDSSSLPSTSLQQPTSTSRPSKPPVSANLSSPVRLPLPSATTAASDVPAASSQSPVISAKKKSALFTGLQKVGDRVKKGITNTPLAGLPHSSTLSDFFGERRSSNINESNQSREQEQQIKAATLASSASENRIVDLERAADDILAKYRKPRPTDSGEMSPESSGSGGPKPAVGELISGLNDNIDGAAPNGGIILNAEEESSTDGVPPYYSPENLTHCRAFIDGKRKLRLVLSNAGSLTNSSPLYFENMRGERAERERAQLGQLLRCLLAEAVNGRNHQLSAQVREVLRCLQVFDDKGVKKLIRRLRDEHRSRTAYVHYLQQSRLALLRLKSFLDKLLARVARDTQLFEEEIVDLLVRIYLESKDSQLKKFLHEFEHLKALDEKIDALNRVLNGMNVHLHSAVMWRSAGDRMRQRAEKTIERLVMQQLFVLAFYPNLEADRHRDELLHKALCRLARTATPSHPSLRIPQAFRGEAPWPSAQAEISIINAYKSAKDKLDCVVRCCETISNLLAMAPGTSVAAADDVTPVLVYVLIQANPHALLSNVQYVASFGGSALEGGREAYWWTQFTAAVELIKTLL